MKPITKLLYALPLLVTQFAQGGEEVDQTIAAAANGNVLVNVVRGEVRIHGWDSAEVKVTGTLDDLTKEFIFDREGDQVRVIVEMNQRPISYGEGSDLDIYLPLGSSLTYKGVSTDLSVKGIGNGITLASVSGNLLIEGVHTRIRANTVSGDLSIRDSDGLLHIVTVSGDVDVQMDTSSASLDSVSGDITATLGTIASLRMNSVSGDCELEARLAADGRIAAESVSGDIRLALQPPVDARIDARSSIGEISNGLNDALPDDSAPVGAGLRTQLGKGSADITLQSVSGDIRLDKL